jgi:hypothetical protein
VVIAALVFTGSQILVFGCFAFLAARFYHRERARIAQDISAALTEFATSPDVDTPSPLAVIIDQAALLLAARMIGQVKAMLAGVESGNAKGEQLALIEEASTKSPLVALVANMVPKRIRNALMRNPQMVAALANLHIGGQGGGGNHGRGQDSDTGSSL